MALHLTKVAFGAESVGLCQMAKLPMPISTPSERPLAEAMRSSRMMTRRVLELVS